MLHRWMLPVLAGTLLITPLVHADKAEDAAKAYLDGQVLLAQGKLPEALAQFEAAAKDDSAKPEYAAAAKGLKKALAQQEQLAKEQDPAKWTKLADELRAYFYAQESFDAALKLDQQRAERQPGTASKLLVVETLFELRKNAEATDLLAAIPEAEQSAASRAYLARGYARQGRKEEAAALLGKFEIPKEVDPQVLYLLASAHAALAHSDEAIAAMTRSLELTPPGEIKARRLAAGRSSDFGPLISNGLFQEAMQTESKVGKGG
jgi:tetratricopeptide (TPR) repeat protein